MRCRYCRGSGHNITNCQDYKNRIEDLRSLHGSDHYAVASYDSKKQRQTRKVEDKTCSFCEQKGHTRRTCQEVSNAKLTIADLNILFRKAVLLNIYKSKTGIGSIVSITDRWDKDLTYLQLCKNIRVADINVWDNGYNMRFTDYFNMTNGKSHSGPAYEDHSIGNVLTESQTFVNVARDWNNAKIISHSQNVPTDVEANNVPLVDDAFTSKSKLFPTSWHAKNVISRCQDLYDRRQQIESDFADIPKSS